MVLIVFLICILLVVNEVKYILYILLAICFSFSMNWHLLKQRLLCRATQMALREKAPTFLAAAQAIAEGTQLSVPPWGLFQLKRAH